MNPGPSEKFALCGEDRKLLSHSLTLSLTLRS